MSMNWSCPFCHGALDKQVGKLRCISCDREYEIVAGIPDLRLEAPAWIDFDVDRARALIIDSKAESDGLEAAVEDVFVTSRGISSKLAKHRTQQVFSGVEKNIREMRSWLLPVLESGDTIEIGCGPGQLLAAAASDGKVIAGIDVSLEWLVIAKHLIRRFGGEPNLVAGLAEHLPIRNEVLGGVISLDVLEHVSDQHTFICEINRVLKVEGSVALATPNRFTIGLEPHVGVWGVGFLPERFQQQWVKTISGKSYAHTRLLSVFETRALFRDVDGLTPIVTFPPIANTDIALFSPAKTILARIYNSLIKMKLVQSIAPFFGAFYRITGVKR